MELLIVITRCLADGILMAVQIAMLVRAVASWFPIGENIITDVAYAVTEPLIIPVRRMLEHFETVRNFPIDIAFFVTFMIVSLLSTLLG